MDSYKQYIKEALPNLSIHSYKQNEEGWDNVAIIVNDELLFRFPRKQEYAMRIPLEKNYAHFSLVHYMKLKFQSITYSIKRILMLFRFVATILSFMVNL